MKLIFPQIFGRVSKENLIVSPFALPLPQNTNGHFTVPATVRQLHMPIPSENTTGVAIRKINTKIFI